MFNVISTILYVAVVLIALLLICLVLVQPSKGGGLGSAFGGIGESVFGAQAMSQLSKVTVVLLTLFFILTLVLAVMTGHRSRSAESSSLVLTQQVKKDEAKLAIPPAAKQSADQPAAKPAPAPVKTLSARKDAKAAPAAKSADKSAEKKAPAKKDVKKQ